MKVAQLLIPAAAALAACLALVALVRSMRRASGPMLARQNAPPPLKGSLGASKRGRRIDVALGREILEMLETGRRAEAVALVRERTGWSAAEADASVAKLERLIKRLES